MTAVKTVTMAASQFHVNPKENVKSKKITPREVDSRGVFDETILGVSVAVA